MCAARLTALGLLFNFRFPTNASIHLSIAFVILIDPCSRICSLPFKYAALKSGCFIQFSIVRVVTPTCAAHSVTVEPVVKAKIAFNCFGVKPLSRIPATPLQPLEAK